ncbi:MAG TPA: multicopper oxidase family protein [Casimicrobiaceae bacterium]|nr:multicopper oxidase family protein [Casimicrobiaceae bacterium]
MTRSTRRDFLKAFAALSVSALPGRSVSDLPRAPGIASDLCGPGSASRPLYVPRDRGFLGRLTLDDEVLTLRAAAAAPGLPWPGGLTRGYVAQARGVEYLDPTLVVRPGQRVRVQLLNNIDEATIVHWHGLAVDTRNDGGGLTVAAPGERYAYDFTVRNRGALYWYHPHPHGLTAGQAYRGMFGMLEVADADEARLRSALDLVPGTSEIPLVLQDRRAGADYPATDADRIHGLLGAEIYVNGTLCPQLDVGTRMYRFRILNASSARTYRLGWRTLDGKPFPFVLVGNDGGLLPAPRRCVDAFLASAERLDVLLDLSDLEAGDAVVLETLAFDPMRMKTAAPADAGAATPAWSPDNAPGGHAMPPGAASATPSVGDGGSLPEGSARVLLALRVRDKTAYRARIPETLSTLPSIDVAQATERPLRLGFAKGRWRINDRVFAMDETPIEVKRNSVEVWLIRNYFNSMPHAMHLHGFAFQVLERQTSPDAIAALKVDEQGRLVTEGGRKDTVLVWPGESVRIAFDFTCPFPGDQTYMFHCHNLEHEDGGMMLGVKLS